MIPAGNQPPLEMYGINHPNTANFGRKCLITPRLIESGVRFVHLYSGGGHIEHTWDGHNNCIANHTLPASKTNGSSRRSPRI